jgi:carbonic anhydrase/acetyltransferase-like protein (isoleucine patch superfamily)
MIRVRRSWLAVAVFTGALLAGPALAAAPAATPPPAAPPVTGTVLSVDKEGLQLRTSEMLQVRVLIGPQTRVVDTINIRLADIKSGDFLGTTASPVDGKLVASEVHVFDEALRGTGEGHYPWTQPGSTMTNGAVATMTNGAVSATGAAQQAAGGGLTMTVTYKGGQQQVTVPAGTTVTKVRVVDAGKLAAGARVTVFGEARDERTLAANLISLTPPAPQPQKPPAAH